MAENQTHNWCTFVFQAMFVLRFPNPVLLVSGRPTDFLCRTFCICCKPNRLCRIELCLILVGKMGKSIYLSLVCFLLFAPWACFTLFMCPSALATFAANVLRGGANIFCVSHVYAWCLYCPFNLFHLRWRLIRIFSSTSSWNFFQLSADAPILL